MLKVLKRAFMVMVVVVAGSWSMDTTQRYRYVSNKQRERVNNADGKYDSNQKIILQKAEMFLKRGN